MKYLAETVCDNCNQKNPETFPNSRLTKCCSTYDKDHPNAVYTTSDEAGALVYSTGKTYIVTN